MAGISITLAGNFQKLDELKDKAQKTASSIKSAFGSDLGKKMFGGVAIAATAAFAGVVASVKSAVDAGGNLNDMMARTGAAGKGLVILQRVFENAGLAATQVPQVLNKMQKALAGVNEEGEPTNAAFAKLGLSIGSLLSLDPVAAFQEIQASISNIQDPAQRTAIAMELFGKSGGELLAVFQDSGAFDQANEQVGSLGETLSENAAALDAVGDAFGALDTKVQQIGASVAVGLLPALTEMSTRLNETDFSQVGTEIADVTSGVIGLTQSIGEFYKQGMFFKLGEQLYNTFGDGSALNADDIAKAKAMAESLAASDPQYMKERGTGSMTNGSSFKGNSYQGETAPVKSAKDVAKEAKKSADDIERAAKAAEKQAAADQKSAEEKAKSRAAAKEEYNLDSAILSARIAGDAKRLESLEREKKIREEIARLTGAGFTEKEARKPAEAKVDAEKKATAKEEAAKKAEEERKKIQDTLNGKLKDVRGKQDSQQFESSVGAISSMQRIGGGGGAVSSGLDYARTAADLQREANTLIRQLIEVSRPEVDA